MQTLNKEHFCSDLNSYILRNYQVCSWVFKAASNWQEISWQSPGRKKTMYDASSHLSPDPDHDHNKQCWFLQENFCFFFCVDSRGKVDTIPLMVMSLILLPAGWGFLSMKTRTTSSPTLLTSAKCSGLHPFFFFGQTSGCNVRGAQRCTHHQYRLASTEVEIVSKHHTTKKIFFVF